MQFARITKFFTRKIQKTLFNNVENSVSDWPRSSSKDSPVKTCYVVVDSDRVVRRAKIEEKKRTKTKLEPCARLTCEPTSNETWSRPHFRSQCLQPVAFLTIGPCAFTMSAFTCHLFSSALLLTFNIIFVYICYFFNTNKIIKMIIYIIKQFLKKIL